MRLSLEIEKTPYEILFSSSELQIPEEAPSVEEALKILASALKSLAVPGSDNTEIRRLQTLVTVFKTYKPLFTNYMHHQEIKKQPVESTAKYEKLTKQKNQKSNFI